jgi:hypothetical protein
MLQTSSGCSDTVVLQGRYNPDMIDGDEFYDCEPEHMLEVKKSISQWATTAISHKLDCFGMGTVR